MPSAQRMTEAANAYWRADNIQNIDRNQFAAPDAMGRFTTDIARGNEFDAGVAGQFPSGLGEMLRALYHHNLNGPRIGIQFVWMPGYDWELTISECPGTPDSPGAFSVVIRGRYPRDPHPSTIK